MKNPPHSELSDCGEIAKRRNAALLRDLSTPHKKQADMKVGANKDGRPRGRRAKEKTPEQGPGSET